MWVNRSSSNNSEKYVYILACAFRLPQTKSYPLGITYESRLISKRVVAVRKIYRNMRLLVPLPLPCFLPLPCPSSWNALVAGDGLLLWLSSLPLPLPLPLPWHLPLLPPPEVPTDEGLQDLIEGATREEENEVKVKDNDVQSKQKAY